MARGVPRAELHGGDVPAGMAMCSAARRQVGNFLTPPWKGPDVPQESPRPWQGEHFGGYGRARRKVSPTWIPVGALESREGEPLGVNGEPTESQESTAELRT
eukprot:1310972-Alexandrium_andersonii.AAC.1